MSTLVQFEPLVDSTSEEFLKQLSQRYADRPDDSGVCDFGEWLQFYAFDVIGELTYSKRLGFVDHGVDVDGIIGSLEWFLGYVAVVGRNLHLLLLHEERKLIHFDCGLDRSNPFLGLPLNKEPDSFIL